MPDATRLFIPNRALIAVGGADALDLLQKLVTADLAALKDGNEARYTLLLTPQGRYRFDFFVIAHAGRLYLDVASGQAAELTAALERYRLRADAFFQLAPQATVLLQTTVNADSFLSYKDGRHEALGFRNWYDTTTAPEITGSAFDYDARRIRLGIVEPADDLPDNAMPLEYGLDKLGCISFDKGCYLGQELTARMHNRDLAKHEIITVCHTGELTGTILAQANDVKLVQVRREGK